MSIKSIDLGRSENVIITSLPLPAGASTSANQVSGNDSLASIDSKLTGAATSALQTQPGVDIGDVTVNNGSGAAAVNIQDGGNSVTVDGIVGISGSVPVTGPLTNTELRAIPLNTAFDGSFLGPFGDLLSVDLTPLVPLDFVYGINSQTGQTTVVSTGVADTLTARLRLQSGTNTSGSAIFNSRKIAKYRPGQGVVARFTGLYTVGVASSTQIIGVGSSTDGYFFGYNGTAFGILHRNGGVNTWTAQNSWNGDTCNGSGASGFNWDKTLGTVMQIKYPYLGYGNITFSVQNPATSAWILCHTIRYNNTSAAVQLSNPNLMFYAQSVNTGNNTNLTLFVGSVGIFVCGDRGFVGSPRWATDNRKTGVSAETVLLSLRNCTIFNGVTNRSLLRLNSLSCASGSATTSTIRLRISATVGGTPAFATISGTTADNGVTITSGNSITSVDIAGTTATGGTYVFNCALGNNGSQMIDLSPLDLYVAPGETLTISGVSNASTELNVSINWSEDI